MVDGCLSAGDGGLTKNRMTWKKRRGSWVYVTTVSVV